MSCGKPVSDYRRLDRSWRGLRCEHLIGVGFFWKMNTCHPWPYIPSVHCFPEGPEGGREGGRGGQGSVMNERHWRTPKAVISDPPPTTQHRQKDNKRKKIPKICHIPGLKTGTQCKRWELRFLLPPLLFLLLLLFLLFWFKSWATLVEKWGGWENSKAYQEIKPLATWLFTSSLRDHHHHTVNLDFVFDFVLDVYAPIFHPQALYQQTLSDTLFPR